MQRHGIVAWCVGAIALGGIPATLIAGTETKLEQEFLSPPWREMFKHAAAEVVELSANAVQLQ